MQGVSIIRKIKNPLQKFLLTAAYLTIIIIFHFMHVPCIFQHFLHIPCPGCGMSRALISALRLDFASAFSYHAMFWSMPVLYLYFLFDGNLFKNRKLNTAVFSLIAAGFLFNWIYHLILRDL